MQLCSNSYNYLCVLYIDNHGLSLVHFFLKDHYVRKHEKWRMNKMKNKAMKINSNGSCKTNTLE